MGSQQESKPDYISNIRKRSGDRHKKYERNNRKTT